jgi:hypothetical protein
MNNEMTQAPAQAEEVNAVSLINNGALGAIKTREFKTSDKVTLTRHTFPQFVRQKFNLADDDTKGLAKARKTPNIQKEYREYCSDLDHTISAVKSKATEDGRMKVRAVEVKTDRESGEILDYVEKYGEVKLPRAKASKVQQLEAEVAELRAKLAESLVAPATPTIEA